MLVLKTQTVNEMCQTLVPSKLVHVERNDDSDWTKHCATTEIHGTKQAEQTSWKDWCDGDRGCELFWSVEK